MQNEVPELPVETQPDRLPDARIADDTISRGLIQTNIERHDVSGLPMNLDLTHLQRVQSAPVWMTRAERLLLYTLTLCLRPRRYLEIGTLEGGSALIVSAAMDTLESDGRLYCVDPQPRISPENWETLSQRTTLITGFSPDALEEARAAAGDAFDLVLVDGDHTYASAKRDADGVLPIVKRGGYILFHDSFFPEVGRAIDEFVDSHRGAVHDLGLLTRDITVQITDDGRRVEWGGIRALVVM